MNNYRIYCSEEQTKKALEFGAPILLVPEEFYTEDKHFCMEIEGEKASVIFPTAEEMIGWLEEQGVWIHFCKPNQRPTLFSYSVSNINKPFRRVFVGGEYASRKEATLAAINEALYYLIKEKNK